MTAAALNRALARAEADSPFLRKLIVRHDDLAAQLASGDLAGALNAAKVIEASQPVPTALRLAKANHTIAVPYASEAGQFQTYGVPTVLCGPGSIEQAHQADEWVEIAQMEECLAFMRRLKSELSR